mgnify:CR=1 FL=1
MLIKCYLNHELLASKKLLVISYLRVPFFPGDTFPSLTFKNKSLIFNLNFIIM